MSVLTCYFCGSDIREMKLHRPKEIKHTKMDRYFIDKKDRDKTMCKLCGVMYIKRQFADSIDPETEGDTDQFWEFIQSRFEMIKL